VEERYLVFPAPPSHAPTRLASLLALLAKPVIADGLEIEQEGQ
jgi:hypothetical protein